MAKDLPEFLSVQDLCRLFGCSRGTLNNWEKDGKFPQRTKLGTHRVGWLKSEIDEHIANLPKGIDAAPRQLREAQLLGKKITRAKEKGIPRGGKIVTDPAELDYWHAMESEWPSEEEVSKREEELRNRKL